MDISKTSTPPLSVVTTLYLLAPWPHLCLLYGSSTSGIFEQTKGCSFTASVSSHSVKDNALLLHSFSFAKFCCKISPVKLCLRCCLCKPRKQNAFDSQLPFLCLIFILRFGLTWDTNQWCLYLVLWFSKKEISPVCKLEIWWRKRKRQVEALTQCHLHSSGLGFGQN